MIKLQDFARQQGVTDRAIQKHLKTYAAELDGLFQRKGPNGTWLTDEACEILRSKMKQTPAAVFEPDPRVGQLQDDLQEVKKMAKEYWEQLKKKEATMELLVKENADLRLQVDSVARLEADNELARQKATEAEKTAWEAQQALTAAHKAFEKDLQKKNEKIEAWEQFRRDLQQYFADEQLYRAEDAAYQKRWFKRKKDKPVPPIPPAPPELQEG